MDDESDFRITSGESSSEDEEDAPGSSRKRVRKRPTKVLPRELQRLITWLGVTGVIELHSPYRTQLVSKADTCERRREAGGFEDDDTDLSPIEESADEGEEIWEIDWRDSMTQIKSDDVSKQHLRELRIQMEASRLLNSRLQDPNEVVRCSAKSVNKGTQQCMVELGLVESDHVNDGSLTTSEGKEMLRQLLPHMIEETMHEKDQRNRVIQWDMIHQVTTNASDRVPHPYSKRVVPSQLGQERRKNVNYWNKRSHDAEQQI
jgi:hypothetical protein